MNTKNLKKKKKRFFFCYCKIKISLGGSQGRPFVPNQDANNNLIIIHLVQIFHNCPLGMGKQEASYLNEWMQPTLN